MSGALALTEPDILKMLAAKTHIGSENSDFQMLQYVYKRRIDGVHIINLKKTWEKLVLAARAIVAIENPSEVFAISTRQQGQRAVLKYSKYTGATPIAGRFTPGAFTNQIQAAFREPRLLVVADPLADHQSIVEASYVNIPVIAFCDVDSPLRYVDIAIPCNTKAPHSLGLMFWFLTREVLRLRAMISRDTPWEIMPDMFFYRAPEDVDKEEQAKQEALAAMPVRPIEADYSAPIAEDWSAEVAPTSWADEATDFAQAAPVAPAAPEQWSAEPVTDDWTAPATTPGTWGGQPEGGW